MLHRNNPNAAAQIRGSLEYGQLRGTARFYQFRHGVIIEVEVTGLPRSETGFYGFHIHSGGSCQGEGFSESGAHFDPGQVPHPLHAGDLPPLLGDQGYAYMKVLTQRFRVKDVIGKTIVIHSEPDDFRTQPSGNAGRKIACGLIEKAGGIS